MNRFESFYYINVQNNNETKLFKCLFGNVLDACTHLNPSADLLCFLQVKPKKTWKERMLRTQQYAHLKYHCKFCRKDYRGLNVMRHVLSHLKLKKLRCILCGKHFKQLPLARKHVMEHIGEMCKQKPSDKEPCTQEAPAANGMVDIVENENQHEGEDQPSPPEGEIVKPKPARRIKLSKLGREARIIRNLRTLIKKTSAVYKKCKNANTNIYKKLDFKDEQVVIKEDLVIVKGPLVQEEGGEEGKEEAAGENGCGVDITYHLCPSETCDRVFLKVSSTLTRHAIRCHMDEEKVLERTFLWAKHKCTLCYR